MRIRPLLVLPLLLVTACSGTGDPARQEVQVVFTGGHETDPRDNGRPVVLIAAALGVEPELFRDAFSVVRPAALGTAPEAERVIANKAVLLAALSPYGITNARLDAVSNHYRYDASAGELWPTRAAAATAVVQDGTVLRVDVTKPGSGYTSAPTATVPGVAGVLHVTLRYGTELATNGGVADVTVG
jgi:hypothetical protein